MALLSECPRAPYWSYSWLALSSFNRSGRTGERGSVQRGCIAAVLWVAAFLQGGDPARIRSFKAFKACDRAFLTTMLFAVVCRELH